MRETKGAKEPEMERLVGEETNKQTNKQTNKKEPTACGEPRLVGEEQKLPQRLVHVFRRRAPDESKGLSLERVLGLKLGHKVRVEEGAEEEEVEPPVQAVPRLALAVEVKRERCCGVGHSAALPRGEARLLLVEPGVGPVFLQGVDALDSLLRKPVLPHQE